MATLEGARTHAELQMAQSLYYAEGGLARANWALVTKEKLEKVGQQLPTGVSACIASEGGQTSGDVDWDGDPIIVTATGIAGPYQRQARSQFLTSNEDVDLKHVITSPGAVQIASPNPPTVSSTVNGPVWSGDPSTDLASVLGTHPVTITDIHMLDVEEAIDDIRDDYAEVVVTGAQVASSSAASPYPMVGGANPGIYYTNDPGLWVPATPPAGCITVTGECLWLIENGANFGKDFSFVGLGTDARLYLLIDKDTNDKGLTCDKTVSSSNLAILVVTDGTIDYHKECTLLSISMYGLDVTAAKGQNFAYDALLLGPWIDSLKGRDLLPEVDGDTNGTLTKIAGSWSELIP